MVSIITFSCKKYDANGRLIKDFEELKKVNWLIGNWENSSDQGLLTEVWIQKNDSTLSGTSFFIKGKDTLHHETIELIQINEQLKYIPTVPSQNNGQPITFNQVVSEDEKTIIFENTKHDYPQKIVYKILDAKHLSVTISGIQQGKPSKESYVMGKSK